MWTPRHHLHTSLGRVVAISVAFEPLAVSITGVVFFSYGISTLEVGGYVVAAAGTAVLALSYRAVGSERHVLPAPSGSKAKHSPAPFHGRKAHPSDGSLAESDTEAEG